MDLINELAVYEKAPEQVTVNFDHFVESGFGPNPVWQAFVAEASPNPSERGEHAENEAKNTLLSNIKKVEAEDQILSSEIPHRPSPKGGVNEGEVIGFALYYIRYSTWKGQRLYLEDLLVTESMRGKGIGKLLFDQLIAEGKEKNYSGMVWQVLDWNEPAIGFYKKYKADFDSGWLNCSVGF